jgi:GNAT superfamily N-acetyltransferase
MNIRLATAQDKEQVLALLDEFSSLMRAKEIPSQIGGAIFDEIVSRKDTKIFVADEQGQLQGLATLYLLPNIRHGWHRGHIEDFFVTPTLRKKGVGTQIFTFMKDYCLKNHVKVIKLDSGNELTDAHAFYEKNGGKTTERFFRFDID